MADTLGIAGSAARVLLATTLCGVVVGCGASEKERLQAQVITLQGDVQRSEQHVADLKVHVGTLRAQNKVLIGLVQGLTAETDKSSAEGTGAAQQALATLDADIQVLATTLKKSREELITLRTQRTQLQTNLGEAMRTIEDAKQRESQAQLRFEMFQAMLLRLKSAIEGERLRLQVIRNQMVVQLPEALLFEGGRAEVTTAGRPLLDDVAAALSQVAGRDFQVAVHTDNVPPRGKQFRSNWDLSSARAIAVARHLINAGVPAEHLSAAAFSDTRPLQPNDTEEHRQANRRVEIVLLPKLDELPDLSTLDEPRDGPDATGTPSESPPGKDDGGSTEPETVPTQPSAPDNPYPATPDDAPTSL